MSEYSISKIIKNGDSYNIPIGPSLKFVEKKTVTGKRITIGTYNYDTFIIAKTSSTKSI